MKIYRCMHDIEAMCNKHQRSIVIYIVDEIVHNQIS